jgi:hypothetical protein
MDHRVCPVSRRVYVKIVRIPWSTEAGSADVPDRESDALLRGVPFASLAAARAAHQPCAVGIDSVPRSLTGRDSSSARSRLAQSRIAEEVTTCSHLCKPAERLESTPELAIDNLVDASAGNLI